MALVNYEYADIAETLNEQVQGRISADDLVAPDLSNIADFGKSINNIGANVQVMRGLLCKIARTIVESKELALKFPYLYKESDEFGLMVEEIRVGLPEAITPQNHNLVAGRIYVDTQYKPLNAKAHYWDAPDAGFEFDYSISNADIKKAFKDASSFMAFVGAQHTAVRNAIKLRKDMVARDCLSAMIAEVVSRQGENAIDLLAMYNTQVLDPSAPDYAPLKKAQAWVDGDFQRFARRVISAMPERLAEPSILYNMEGDPEYPTWTETLHTILLNDFVRDNEAYFLTDAFRDVINLPEHDTVDFWLAPGKTPTIETRSTVAVAQTQMGSVFEQSGVVGVMFDDRAVGIRNEGESARENHVASGDFLNYYITCDGKGIMKPDKNFVVFFLGDDYE